MDDDYDWDEILVECRLCPYCEDYTADYGDQLLEVIRRAARGDDVTDSARFLDEVFTKDNALTHQASVQHHEAEGANFPALGYRFGVGGLGTGTTLDELDELDDWSDDEDSLDMWDPTASTSSMGPNAHPLVVTLFGSASDEPATFEARVMHAAVHAWMEGHVCAPGHPPLLDTDKAMPAPPFPARDSTQLKAIVDETLTRFDPIQIVAATAYAASLAWVAGEAEGSTCGGCAVERGESEWARALRHGDVTVRYFLRRDLPVEPPRHS